MREILFRGKRKDNKEWIEGCYIESVAKNSPFAYITPSYPSEPIRVYSKTVGQYTGLQDCKRTKEYPEGQKIFEGDIVKIELLGGFEIGHITYSKTGCRFKFADRYGSTYGFDDTCTFEVIGNIHDNPELLKGDKSDA